MKIEITKTVKQVETIEVELPCYFKQEIELFHKSEIVYVKMDENLCTVINEVKNTHGKEGYEVKKQKLESIEYSDFSFYFNTYLKSSEQEFESAKERFISYVKNC